MRYILNIGLNIPGTGRAMHPELALDAVRNMLAKGERILSSPVHASRAPVLSLPKSQPARLLTRVVLRLTGVKWSHALLDAVTL